MLLSTVKFMIIRKQLAHAKKLFGTAVDAGMQPTLQEIASILCNLKVHSPVYNSPSLLPITRPIKSGQTLQL
jgi:hypothetical protein